MAVLKKNFWFLILFIFIGTLLGGVLGEILRSISPEGFLRNAFTEGFFIGISPPITFDLRIISFTIGFTLRANLLTLLGTILGVYIYKHA
ncbi:MAG: DUF4321 domain-containing protein [Nitrospirae bacterium]|nr:DUF4321 domain-containing protein [Nitrospirota bacterium]